MWARLAPGLRRYLDTDVELPRAWAGFSLEFDANENSLPPAAVEVGFSVAGGAVLLDDVEPGADRRRSREPDSLPRRSGGDAEGAAARRTAADGERCGAGQHGRQSACAAGGARAGRLSHMVQGCRRHSRGDSGVSGTLPGGWRGAVDRGAHGDEPGRDAQAGRVSGRLGGDARRSIARGRRKARAVDGGLPHHSHRAGQRNMERGLSRRID